MMRRNHWLVSGFTGVLLSATLPAAGETLQEAMAATYGSNPTLLSERAKLRATDELVPQALANWRPSVVLSGNATRSNLYSSINSGSAVVTGQPTAATTITGSSVYSNETVGVTVTQPIFRGGRTVAQTRQAEAQVDAERATLAVTEQQILLNVASAYLNLVQAQAVLQLRRNNEQVLQRQLESVQERFRVGEVTRTDVAQAESRLAGAHADRTQAEGDLRTARAVYLQTVGHQAEKTEMPSRLPSLPGSFEQALAGAAQDNPALRAARSLYQAALEGVDLIEGELLPSVALSGSASRFYNFTGPSSLENVAQVMVGVTVPLYQQGQEYARLRGQKETAGQMHSSLDQTQRDIEEATAAAWEALQASRARLTSFEAQIKAAEIALEGVKRENQVGSRTVIEVLNAEEELMNAQVNKVQAQHDEMLAAYRLLNAAGQLTAEYLGLAVDLYDPNRHYEEVRDKWIGFGDRPEPDKIVK
jgi:outer membrane protein